MCILALQNYNKPKNEVGAKFRAAGIDTIVSAYPSAPVSTQALVLDTETRHLAPAEAGRVVSSFVTRSGVRFPRLIYKKTDSTLRGNIDAELGALAALFPDWRIGYAPAYPALGRTVKSGVLYVDGIPVAESRFASDALNPVSTSAISAILDPGLPCCIFDGETESDLVEAARAILSDKQMRIAAGPAGLAGSIAAELDVPRVPPLALPSLRSCVVINGSRHERSATQMRYAAGSGWHVLRTQHDLDADPVRVAGENARGAIEQLAAKQSDAALIIGGDTAFAFVRALGLPMLLPIAEVVPGVPITRIAAGDLAAIPGRTRDLYLITKAGGFGNSETLAHVRESLCAI